jgi:mRNA interferase MazF
MAEQIKEILDRIIAWTKLKCRVVTTEHKPLYFREREVWWAYLGQNIGSEQNGKGIGFARPVLIVKKLSVRLFIAIPLTTVAKNGSLNHRLFNERSKREDFAIISQVRTLSSRRLIEKQRVVSAVDFLEIRRILREML